jgi:hypothetical protein
VLKWRSKYNCTGRSIIKAILEKRMAFIFLYQFVILSGSEESQNCA